MKNIFNSFLCKKFTLFCYIVILSTYPYLTTIANEEIIVNHSKTTIIEDKILDLPLEINENDQKFNDKINNINNKINDFWFDLIDVKNTLNNQDSDNLNENFSKISQIWRFCDAKLFSLKNKISKQIELNPEKYLQNIDKNANNQTNSAAETPESIIKKINHLNQERLNSFLQTQDRIYQLLKSSYNLREELILKCGIAKCLEWSKKQISKDIAREVRTSFIIADKSIAESIFTYSNQNLDSILDLLTKLLTILILPTIAILISIGKFNFLINKK